MKGLIWVIMACLLIAALLNQTPTENLVSDIQDIEKRQSLLTESEELYIFLTEEFNIFFD